MPEKMSPLRSSRLRAVLADVAAIACACTVFVAAALEPPTVTATVAPTTTAR